jgi:hypothetical protein
MHLFATRFRLVSAPLGTTCRPWTYTPSRWGSATRKRPSVPHQPDPTRYYGFAQGSSIALSGRDRAMSPARMTGAARAPLAWRSRAEPARCTPHARPVGGAATWRSAPSSRFRCHAPKAAPSGEGSPQATPLARGILRGFGRREPSAVRKFRAADRPCARRRRPQLQRRPAPLGWSGRPPSRGVRCGPAEPVGGWRAAQGRQRRQADRRTSRGCSPSWCGVVAAQRRLGWAPARGLE